MPFGSMKKRPSKSHTNSRLSSDMARCVQGAEINLDFFSESKKLFREALFWWVNQNRKKLTAYAYSLGKHKISWAEAEELVSNLIIDIQLGRFDNLLPKEKLAIENETIDLENHKVIVGSIYNKLWQHFIAIVRWKTAKCRDYKLTSSMDQMLPSSLESLILQKPTGGNSQFESLEKKQQVAMKTLLERISTEIYPNLGVKDRAILDAIDRVPEERKIHSGSIMEAMTKEEQMLFVDQRQKPVVIDPIKIRLAIYRRHRILIEYLLKHFKTNRPHI